MTAIAGPAPRASRTATPIVLGHGRLEFVLLCGLFTLLQTGLGGSGGAAVVASELAIFALLLATRWNRGLERLLLFSPLLAYPLLTVVSTVWSLAPAITLRYSLELMFTCVVGIYIGLYRRPSDIVKIVFIATALGMLLSIASDRQGQSAAGNVLVGLVGSKNAMAFLAQWASLSALAVLLLPNASLALRLAALLVIAPAAYVALHVQAAAATMTVFAGFALLASLYLLARSPAAIRYAVAVALIAALVIAYLLRHLLIGWAENFIIQVLHKNLTLTGRTVLWDYAKEFMARRPLLGRGYKEIWAGGSVDTLGLLRFAKITDGRGFYFHETYLDAGVDCGMVGVVILLLSFLFILAALGWRFLRAPSVSLAYLLSMDVLLMARSVGETLMQPLSPYCALIFCCGVVAVTGGAAQRAPQDAGRDGHGRRPARRPDRPARRARSAVYS